jgi:2'-hydroxyisoflavone reductase
MKILILGGTKFVGRAIVERCLENGHSVSLFHRGKTNPELFPECEHLIGDRREDLSALESGEWDAVIDCCAYIPREITLAVAALKDRVKKYTLISTISVFADLAVDSIDDDDRLEELDDPTVEEVNRETYGGLKVLCERELAKAYGGEELVIRPGIVAGPYDPTDRFTYWAVKGAEGTETLCPNRLDQPMQFIDVRDLAAFTVSLTEQGESGYYSAVGPQLPITLGHLTAVCGFGDNLKLATEKAIQKAELQIPLTLPGDKSYDGIFSMDTSKAQAKGLTFRPIKETVEATVAWWKDQGSRDLSTEIQSNLIKNVLCD